ncbi:unnamed protein product [Durusdinium trenchii]|uniref:Uncharacterized protein n=1 Tax=Durusdinium trenchii TaxID=1381693 RepID=A0ABP0P0L9_9DINO
MWSFNLRWYFSCWTTELFDLDELYSTCGDTSFNLKNGFFHDHGKEGIAWKLCEDFNLDKAEDPEALQEILKILDGSFQYDANVEMPADFSSYFEHLARKPGQTLLNYVTDHDDRLKQIEKHGVRLPTQIQGWFLLTKAALTREQKQMIVTQAASLERAKIQQAMFAILGQDYKGGGQLLRDRWNRAGSGKGCSYFAGDDSEAFFECDDNAPTYDEEDDAYYMDDEENYDDLWWKSFDADEYLLDLTSSFESEQLTWEPSFDLQLDEKLGDPGSLEDFLMEEHLYQVEEQMPPEDMSPVTTKHWKTLVMHTQAQLKSMNTLVDQAIKQEHQAPPRVLWEVYTGRARLSQMAAAIGMTVKTFSFETFCMEINDLAQVAEMFCIPQLGDRTTLPQSQQNLLMKLTLREIRLFQPLLLSPPRLLNFQNIQQYQNTFYRLKLCLSVQDDHGIMSNQAHMQSLLTKLVKWWLKSTANLPHGWTFNKNNNSLELKQKLADFWEVKGCLIRHHVRPRSKKFLPGDQADLPVPLEKLDDVRVTIFREPGQEPSAITDHFKTENVFKRHSKEAAKGLPSKWVGCTIFQINAVTRKECGMTATLSSSSPTSVKPIRKAAQHMKNHCSTYIAAERRLKEVFEFRSWQEDHESMEYCGVIHNRKDFTWNLSQSHFLHKEESNYEDENVLQDEAADTGPTSWPSSKPLRTSMAMIIYFTQINAVTAGPTGDFTQLKPDGLCLAGDEPAEEWSIFTYLFLFILATTDLQARQKVKLRAAQARNERHFDSALDDYAYSSTAASPSWKTIW